MKKYLKLFIIISAIQVLLFCGNDQKTGSLSFYASGEDFVRSGFTTRDGWRIRFNHLYVNISDITAYMPGSSDLRTILQGPYLVDLAAGNDKSLTVLVDKKGNVKAGNYQALAFKIKRTHDGTFKGSSIILIGTARKKTQKRSFTIKFNEEVDFNGAEGYVGESVKGIVSPDNETDVEMTFHIDHIFGDNTAPADSHVNVDSVGFNYFDRFKKGSVVNVSQDELKSTAEYSKLIQSIWNLGHLGEGHCEAKNMSSSYLIKNKANKQ